MTETHKKYSTFRKDQRAFFDSLIDEDPEYYWTNEAYNFCRQWESRRVLKNVRAARILDVGCGSGFHDVEMANCPAVESVVGIDYSERSVALANEKFAHPKVERYVADIDTFSDAAPFDLVVSFQVFEHHYDPSKFLRQCADRARAGGYVAIVTPNRLRMDNVVRRLRGGEACVLDPQHFAEYSMAELTAFGSELGLRVVDRFGRGFFVDAWPWTQKMPVDAIPRSGRLCDPSRTLSGSFSRSARPDR